MPDNFQACLVELVESRPILYDRRCPGYKDETEKQKAWCAVAAVLRGMGFQCQPADIQHEWLRIRERYARERKKLDQPDCGNRWNLMQHLDFLENVVRYRRSFKKQRSLPVDAILSVSSTYNTFSKECNGDEFVNEDDETPCVKNSAESDDHLLLLDSDSSPPPILKKPKLYAPPASCQVTPITSPGTFLVKQNEIDACRETQNTGSLFVRHKEGTARRETPKSGSPVVRQRLCDALKETPSTGSFTIKQREGDTLKETLNSYLSVVVEMSQNINTLLHNKTEKTSSSNDPDEESLRGFIMGLLPFWKAIELKERATLMSSITALFAEALQKNGIPE